MSQVNYDQQIRQIELMKNISQVEKSKRIRVLMYEKIKNSPAVVPAPVAPKVVPVGPKVVLFVPKVVPKVVPSPVASKVIQVAPKVVPVAPTVVQAASTVVQSDLTNAKTTNNVLVTDENDSNMKRYIESRQAIMSSGMSQSEKTQKLMELAKLNNNQLKK